MQVKLNQRNGLVTVISLLPPDSFYLLVLMFSTVVVNFVDLTGLRDTGKALFLGVSGRD